MFCNKCGAKAPEESLFCGKCGAPLDVKKAEKRHSSQISQEETYKWASKALNGSDSEAALEALKNLAESGHKDALYDIYNYYAEIDFSSQDTFYYIKLLYKYFPEQFDAGMLGTLAFCSFSNMKTPDDAKRTMNLCLEAYKMGNDMMPFFIGEMYYRELGVPHDLKKAAEWYEISARINPTLYEGVARWGYFVYHGIGGVRKDKYKGRQLWLEAARHGNEAARKYLKENPDTLWDKLIY